MCSQISITTLQDMGVRTVQVGVCEVPIQEGIFRAQVPSSEEDLVREETRDFLRAPELCFANEGEEK